MEDSTALEGVLKRDRAVVLAGIVAIVALSWAYMLYLAWNVEAMGAEIGMAQARHWGVTDLALTFVMWAVMMVAMMAPSAAPMILTFATVNRRRRDQQRPYVPTGVFLGGYVAAWTAFSLLATVAQWGLHTAALISPMMTSTSPYLSGGLLLVAGAFQWSRLKYACLTECRSPLGFMMTEWRDGAHGALAMGWRHGLYCLGCCWALMALLFVLGVMNLLWIAALAAVVLVEKVAPAGHWFARATGVALACWGVFVVYSSLA